MQSLTSRCLFLRWQWTVSQHFSSNVATSIRKLEAYRDSQSKWIQVNYRKNLAIVFLTEIFFSLGKFPVFIQVAVQKMMTFQMQVLLAFLWQNRSQKLRKRFGILKPCVQNFHFYPKKKPSNGSEKTLEAEAFLFPYFHSHVTSLLPLPPLGPGPGGHRGTFVFSGFPFCLLTAQSKQIPRLFLFFPILVEVS